MVIALPEVGRAKFTGKDDPSLGGTWNCLLPRNSPAFNENPWLEGSFDMRYTAALRESTPKEVGAMAQKIIEGRTA